MTEALSIDPVRRPILRWHGGKWMLAPWIINHFPLHHVYVEAFGGAASVLLRKPRAYAEIYNDLDDEAVNLFRVLRSDRAEELIAAIEMTPFARAEFEGAYIKPDDPVELARHLIVRSFQGFGSDGHNRAVRTGFRAASNRSGNTPAQDWNNLPDSIALIVKRLKGVVIEHRDALDVMRQHDAEDTLHYVDPPYLPDTRSQKSRRGKIRYHAYTHEMATEDQDVLLAGLVDLKGMVVLSGYPSPVYEAALGDWHRVERPALADGARPRTEVLWLNPLAHDRLFGHGGMTVTAKAPLELRA